MHYESLLSTLPGVLLGVAAIISAMRGATKRMEARLSLIETHLTNHLPHQIAAIEQQLAKVASCTCKNKENHGPH